MNHVFRHIEACSAAYAQEPLFVYLRDERVDPQDKLQFVPWASHFVMTFADLYHFFLINEPPRDRFEELTNIHLSEEGTHWKWFLNDLGVLGLDPTMRFTDAVKFIWSDETIQTRRLAYEICKLSAGLTSLHRLVMVNAIEATGRVTLEALIPAGVAIEARLGQKLVYFGDHHLDTERQHTLEDEAVRKPIEDLALDDAVRAELCGVVDRVFEHFRGFTDDSFRVAQRRARFVERGATVGPEAAARAAAPPPR